MTTGGLPGETALPRELADIAFLIGAWRGEGVSEGEYTHLTTSSIRPVASGTALLCQDDVDARDTEGEPIENFDRIMLIYLEGGTLRADYLDDTHVIHYTRAIVEPGRHVQFIAEAVSIREPGFRLSYTKTADNTLSTVFEVYSANVPPVTVATGTLTRE